MNLAKVLGLNLEGVKIVLVGVPELTNLLDSDEQPYYAAQLKDPITVRCSVDPEILPYEASEVYVRKAALDAEGWELVDANKPEEGFFRPGWVVDFSKGQQIAIYQSESIKKWSRGNRGEQRIRNREVINSGIREKIAAKANK